MLLSGTVVSMILTMTLLGLPPAQPIPKFDKIFEKTSGWTGADGAYTVPLSGDVTLWLFSDTWVGDVVDGKHKNARLVNNSIGIQKGMELSTCEMEFYWGPDDAKGKPTALVTPDDERGWFWLFHGAFTGDKLYLFLMQQVKRESKSVFGFQMVGTWMGEINNPLASPSEWHISQTKIPFGRYSNKGNFFFGSATVQDDEWTYIFGCDEDWGLGFGGRSMILARAPIDSLGDFPSWNFWDGETWQRKAEASKGLFRGIAAEYSVSYLPSQGRYVCTYTEAGMSPNILVRFAPAPEGPWGSPQKIFTCPEVTWHKTYFTYAAKAHPELSFPDSLVITYVCNSTNFWQMCKDATIYRPRFIRLSLIPQ